MRIFWTILAILVVALASWALTNYLLQRRRGNKAQADGVVVYATVLSVSAVGGWAKRLELKKILLRLQEPDDPMPREVTLQTRLQAGQRVVSGHRLAVVVDPTDAKRVYPAGPDAAKRIQITGSREERRQMKAAAAGKRPTVRRVSQVPGPMPGSREKRR